MLGLSNADQEKERNNIDQHVHPDHPTAKPSLKAIAVRKQGFLEGIRIRQHYQDIG